MTLTNLTKAVTSFTNALKGITSLTNTSKTSTSFYNSDKPTTSMDNGVHYLLKEDTFFLLLENGFKIILDQSWNDKYTPVFTNLAKS